MKRLGNFIGNIIWFVVYGAWMTVLHLALGVALCATIVLIPFGVQHFKIAKYSVWPFGHDVVLGFDDHPVMNLLWVFFGGALLALVHLIVGVVLCITLIGIPLAKKCFCLSNLCFIPCGAKVV